MRRADLTYGMGRASALRQRRRLVRVAAVAVLIAVAVLAALWAAGVTPVWGQEEGVQAQSAATYAFGQNLRFSLRAKSVEEISGATLFFNTPEMSGTFAVDFELEPAREVTLEHEVALTQVQLAPFTTVRYWWRLNTDGGARMVDEQMLAYVDDRFQWQELSGDGIDVYWTGSDSSLGQAALDVIAAVRPQLETVLPVDIAPVRVYVYPSMADLRSALRLTGRDWLGAEAMPELGVVLVTAVNPRTAALDLGQSIPHELSHLLLYRATGAQYESVPRWFDEGLATNVEMTPDAGNRGLLREAIAGQATIPIAQLCATFPASESDVRLAYAQSAALVQYMRNEYGTQALRELVAAYADGAGCDGGVRRVLGISMEELEMHWLARERPVSPMAQFLRMNGLWVALAGGGFLIMGLLLIPLRRERR